MSTEEARVSVILPTMASAARREMLQRAVLSVRASSRHPLRIIAVVNGDRRDDAACRWLQAQPDVQYVYLPQPSAPGAVEHGRELVRTAFYSMLDDDDEYLPGATDEKLAALQAAPDAALLVGNYYHCSSHGESLSYSRLGEVPADPLRSLMRFNWLHNGNALFRSSEVGVEYFRNTVPYAEWTWLAFRLAMDGKKVAVLDKPVFRYNITAGSLSQSETYHAAYVSLFQRMLQTAPPAAIRQLLRRRLVAAYHDASSYALDRQRMSEAWCFHLKSLMSVHGLKYLTYTRHLL